jgi:hypothetical protein
LVREHSATIKPPRALWVPYELGRPLGRPNDADFQKRVLRACLGLLKAKSGPVLEDYPEDIPPEAAESDMTGMFCPIDLPPLPSNDSELAQSLLQEIARIAPWYEIAVNQRKRTTVGISELDIEDAARFIADFVEDTETPSPRPGVEIGPMLKYATEDLKAFYSEAISAQPGMSSSLAVEDWLWNETVLGKTLWKLRDVCIPLADPYASYFGKRSLIPDRQIHLKGADHFETLQPLQATK